MNEDEGSLNQRFSDEDHFSENYEQHTLTESEITDPSEITEFYLLFNSQYI